MPPMGAQRSAAIMRQRKASVPSTAAPGSAPSSPSNRPGSFMPSKTTSMTAENAETSRPTTLRLDHVATLPRRLSNLQYIQPRRLTSESASCLLCYRTTFAANELFAVGYCHLSQQKMQSLSWQWLDLLHG